MGPFDAPRARVAIDWRCDLSSLSGPRRVVDATLQIDTGIGSEVECREGQDGSGRKNSSLHRPVSAPVPSSPGHSLIVCLPDSRSGGEVARAIQPWDLGAFGGDRGTEEPHRHCHRHYSSLSLCVSPRGQQVGRMRSDRWWSGGRGWKGFKGSHVYSDGRSTALFLKKDCDSYSYPYFFRM